MTNSYPKDKFTLFSFFNKSKFDGKENEYWAKAEWPIEQIQALYQYATDPSTRTMLNKRGERCIVVSQKLLPRTSEESGNSYLMGVTTDQKEEKKELPF